MWCSDKYKKLSCLCLKSCFGKQNQKSCKRKIFFLLNQQSSQGMTDFSYFMAWSAIILKCGRIFFGKCKFFSRWVQRSSALPRPKGFFSALGLESTRNFFKGYKEFEAISEIRFHFKNIGTFSRENFFPKNIRNFSKGANSLSNGWNQASF